MAVDAVNAALVERDLREANYFFQDEDSLQRGIWRTLAAKYPVELVRREAILDARCRIDFLVDGVGIECKVAGSRAEVLRQLTRYADFDEIEALVLVTCIASHTRLPDEIDGKKLRVVNLALAGL